MNRTDFINRARALCHRFGAASIICLSLVAWLTLSAPAQSIQPIYSFANCPAQPDAALTLGPDGNFYGTTLYGGSADKGTVFRITPNGDVTLLASFVGTNGAHCIAGLTLGPDGDFYGTTLDGGSFGFGTVFRITTDGTLTTLAGFGNTNGANPYSGVTPGPDGNFYGTTYSGGSGGYGTVFRITTGGALTTLASFSSTNGAYPQAGLTLGPDGNFYGTTEFTTNFDGGYGTIFRITTNGALTTVVNFDGTNGANPGADLTLGPDGNLFGTTSGGGFSRGTVFRVTTDGVLTTLASFNFTNGADPQGALTLGPDGSVYGTAVEGGSSYNGTVFVITTNGTLTTLVNFAGTNGANPYGGLTLAPDGSFYGAADGGSSGKGVVFHITTNGALTTLADFVAANGVNPGAALTLGPDGNFYGTTEGGGSNGDGTIFKITGNGALATLASFAYTNGADPEAPLTLGPDGNFYGTTFYGSTAFLVDGTVFRMTTSGGLTMLVNGGNPAAGLTLGPDGNFYGTTFYGGRFGEFGEGTVFRMTTSGTLTTLASFDNTNGANPFAAVTLGPDGDFYGTTAYGGSANAGTVFQITTNGTLTSLYSFSAIVATGTGNYTNADGAHPDGGLIVGPDGSFYGTASIGGSGGDGTVFQITTHGTLTNLHSFSAKVSDESGNETNADGAYPDATLTLGPDGNFYGTAYSGGSSGYGTVFRITANGVLTTLASFVNGNGANPFAALTLGLDGNFYGNTFGGGSGGGGVIYRLNLPPSIITQPSNQIVLAGSNPIFTLTLFGTAPFGYQWLYNSTPIAGATNSTLTIPDVMPSSAGNYQVIVTNTWGSVTSTVAMLSVLTVPPTITNQPFSESVPTGGTASFAVGATGTPPLAYQWYFSRQQHAHSRTQPQEPLPGATNTTFSFGPVHPNQDGNYQVIVASPYGSATSDVANLTVLLRPNFYAISNSASGTMTLLLVGTPGSTNRLWATTNLSLPFAQWQPISTNTADPTGLFQFTDTNTGHTPAKFYILSSP